MYAGYHAITIDGHLSVGARSCCCVPQHSRLGQTHTTQYMPPKKKPKQKRKAAAAAAPASADPGRASSSSTEDTTDGPPPPFRPILEPQVGCMGWR